MKISFKWLAEYVDIHEFGAKPEELGKKLTAAGIEVEDVINRAKDFQNVVVARIVELGRHPNADRLTLCQVDVGDGKLRQIVCGAKNHKQGDRVIAALPGAVLPGNFEIKLSKIRDVESQGMLCSESELGLKDESEGIVILPADAPIGKAYAEYAGANDVIFELSVTPNRADCLSHLGLAREIACLLGRAYEAPAPDFTTGGAWSKSVKLSLNSEKLCPRYAGRVVKNVKVGPSPQWLKQRLEAVDIKSINNVVDVTNFVMLELGQPLHAFDISQLRGEEIIIDTSKSGEKFITLDGTEIQLTGQELTIRDGKGPVALAGVVGGKNSGVTEKTQDIFIESAYFVAETVRKTSRKFGIETDSAYRFSRGTDPEMVLLALNRAAELMHEVASGQVASDFHDQYPKPFKPQPIIAHLSYVGQRLGYGVGAEAFNSWMKRLGCQIQGDKGGDIFQVTPPPFRGDLKAEVDLVEEFGRLNGYDNIPETLPPLVGAPAAQDTRYLHEERVIDILKGEGFFQAVNYGFVSSKLQSRLLGTVDRLKALGLNSSPEAVKLRNPLNEELDVMRVSLIPGLFTNACHNIRRGNLLGRLFECGAIFSRDVGYSESVNIGLISWGQEQNLWSKEQNRPTIFDLKQAIESLLGCLGLGASLQWKKLEGSQAPEFLHPKQAAGLFVEGRMIGYAGSLHPSIAAEEKLRVSVAVGEIDMEKLMRGQPKALKLKSLSPFPAVERDLAVVISREQAAGELSREIQKTGGELIRSVKIFDVFEGEGVPEGMRSVAYRYVVQDSKATLSEDALQSLHNRILGALEAKFKAKVR